MEINSKKATPICCTWAQWGKTLQLNDDNKIKRAATSIKKKVNDLQLKVSLIRLWFK